MSPTCVGEATLIKKYIYISSSFYLFWFSLYTNTHLTNYYHYHFFLPFISAFSYHYVFPPSPSPLCITVLQLAQKTGMHQPQLLQLKYHALSTPRIPKLGMQHDHTLVTISRYCHPLPRVTPEIQADS